MCRGCCLCESALMRTAVHAMCLSQARHYGRLSNLKALLLCMHRSCLHISADLCPAEFPPCTAVNACLPSTAHASTLEQHKRQLHNCPSLAVHKLPVQAHTRSGCVTVHTSTGVAPKGPQARFAGCSLKLNPPGGNFLVNTRRHHSLKDPDA